MKYKVGDIVSCQVETRKSGTKAVVARHLEEPLPKLETKLFEIITINIVAEDLYSYVILIADDMLGWTISEWHILHQKVDPKFKGKKFYELTEEFINVSENK